MLTVYLTVENAKSVTQSKEYALVGTYRKQAIIDDRVKHIQ